MARPTLVICETVGDLIKELSQLEDDQPLGKKMIVDARLIQDRYQTVKIYEKEE